MVEAMDKSKDQDQSTEQKILVAAKQVFIEKGLAGARMQDIADRAGINKALLHYYFRSKDRLFEVIFLEAVQRFLPRVNILFESDQPLFEKIRDFIRTYIDMLIENPYLPSFVLHELHKQEPTEFLQRIWNGKQPAIHKFIEQVNKEAAAGIIKPVSPVNLMLNMVSMCIFPFVGKPMAKMVWQLNDKQFLQLMHERKTSVAEFVIDSIRT